MEQPPPQTLSVVYCHCLFHCSLFIRVLALTPWHLGNIIISLNATQWHLSDVWVLGWCCILYHYVSELEVPWAYYYCISKKWSSGLQSYFTNPEWENIQMQPLLGWGFYAVVRFAGSRSVFFLRAGCTNLHIMNIKCKPYISWRRSSCFLKGSSSVHYFLQICCLPVYMMILGLLKSIN